MRSRRSVRTTVLAAALVATASVGVLTGCAQNSREGQPLGQPIEAGLYASDFDGSLNFTAESFDKVSASDLESWKIDPLGQDAYLATFTISVASGDYDADTRDAFGNDKWGVTVDGETTKGPALYSSFGIDREALNKACPNDKEARGAALAAGDEATACALLLTEAGSTPSEVAFVGASSDARRSIGGDIISWSVEK
ncbi:hypothetical protein ACPEEZ_01540 [Frigoribacterium sp. 2-23]|uniref:hypothetical protein n=1 Tax=Frigoribacterium sp. 2-23 TaxID=3415006 RepID=UPI003C6FABA7